MRSSIWALGGALGVLLAAFATACTGGGDKLLAESQLRLLVLQPADLSREWTRFDEGRQLRADAPPGARADPTRFDRLDGWKARYRRPGSADTDGPLVVESRADLFEGASGAEEDFELAVGHLGERAETIELGDEARAATSSSSAPGQFVTVTVVWREQNVVAALTANGFSGALELADVVELARMQQQRLEDALR